MRSRLINCIDALLVGIILGLLFVTLVHASPSAKSTGPPSALWSPVRASIQTVLK